MRRRDWARSLVIACALGCGSAPKAENPPESAPKPRDGVQSAQVTHVPLPAAPAAPAPSAMPADIQKVLDYDPKDPLADLEAADALDRMANGGPENGAKKPPGKPPANGCVVVDEGRRVWPAPGPAAIVAVGRAFVVAGYAQRNGREQLFVVRAPTDALPEPIAALDVQPQLTRARTAPPGLAVRDENDISVAQVDGAGKLTVRRLRLGHAGHGAVVELATGIDIRFAPAVETHQERTLVAWTVGSTPMHTQLAVLTPDDQIESRHDLTPSSMGAAAPVFVSGASPPVLMAVDARNGMSPLLRVDFGNNALPQAAQVAVPVSMVSSPPVLAAAAGSVGTYVAFTGLGSAATSAVGLVAIAPIAGTPSTMIPGTGYGPLYVAATAAPRALLFAADAPTKPGKDAPREIRVQAIGVSGPGPVAVIKGAGSAAHAGIARTVEGEVGVVFSAESGVYVARLRCDDGG